MEEVATGIGALTVTTSVIESTNLGFACADVDDIINRTVSWRTRCAEIGAAIVQTGLQCECETSETFYTKGVEELEIAFEHSYSTTSRVTVSGAAIFTAARPLQPTVSFLQRASPFPTPLPPLTIAAAAVTTGLRCKMTAQAS